MQVLYWDCFSGISGDMLLGALADLGVDMSKIEAALNQFLPERVQLIVKKVRIQGIAATDVEVLTGDLHRVERLENVRGIIEQSPLSAHIQEQVLGVFERIARAEARVHGKPVEEIHFHEMGSLDTLVDVIGTILALEELGSPRIFCSPVPLGRGFQPMMHGIYPLPAPAVLELLAGIPCYGVDAGMELVTPTGAALLSTLSQEYGPLPPMRLAKIGYGAGKNRRPEIPNVLRIVQGVIDNDIQSEQVGVVETSIDDLNPEVFSYIFERFYQLPGARDIYVQPVIMKKNRPGFLVTCLVEPAAVPAVIDFLGAETSTTGIRYRIEWRAVLQRRVITVSTRFGEIAVKVSGTGTYCKASPEYESCRKAALRYGVPLIEVYREALTRVYVDGELNHLLNDLK